MDLISSTPVASGLTNAAIALAFQSSNGATVPVSVTAQAAAVQAASSWAACKAADMVYEWKPEWEPFRWALEPAVAGATYGASMQMLEGDRGLWWAYAGIAAASHFAGMMIEDMTAGPQ